MGIDISASYTIDRFKISTEQNQLFFYKTEGFPGAGFADNPAGRGFDARLHGDGPIDRLEPALPLPIPLPRFEDMRFLVHRDSVDRKVRLESANRWL